LVTQDAGDLYLKDEFETPWLSGLEAIDANDVVRQDLVIPRGYT
jgi:hypothetical protein